MNSLNISLVKEVPLSATIVSGSPCVAKMHFNSSIVAVAVMLGKTCASILYCESSNTKNVAPTQASKVQVEPGPWSSGPLLWVVLRRRWQHLISLTL